MYGRCKIPPLQLRARFILERGSSSSTVARRAGRKGRAAWLAWAQGTFVFSRSGSLRACMLSGARPLIVTVIHSCLTRFLSRTNVIVPVTCHRCQQLLQLPTTTTPSCAQVESQFFASGSLTVFLSFVAMSQASVNNIEYRGM